MTTDAELAAALDDVIHEGWTWLVGEYATPDNAKAIRRMARAQRIRVRYSSGRTMHGTPIITVERVYDDGATFSLAARDLTTPDQ